MLNLYNLINKSKNKDSDVTKQSEKEKKADFTKYVSREDNLTTGRLKWGMWYVRNRVLLYRIFVISLIVINVVIFTYSLSRAIALFMESPQHKQMVLNLATFDNYNNLQVLYRAQPLQVADVRAYQGGVDKYDVVAEISNPNNRFVVSFEYSFIFNNNETKKLKTFLLPGESRPVPYLGIASSFYSSDPQIKLSNIKWKRISAHEVKDIKTWQKKRIDFTEKNIKFTQAVGASEDGANAHVIEFDYVNNSPFNYNNPKFYVVLYQGSSLVGILPWQTDSFSSLEIKKVDLRSFTPSLSANSVVVYPVINIYDKEAYVRNR